MQSATMMCENGCILLIQRSTVIVLVLTLQPFSNQLEENEPKIVIAKTSDGQIANSILL